MSVICAALQCSDQRIGNHVTDPENTQLWDYISIPALIPSKQGGWGRGTGVICTAKSWDTNPIPSPTTFHQRQGLEVKSLKAARWLCSLALQLPIKAFVCCWVGSANLEVEICTQVPWLSWDSAREQCAALGLQRSRSCHASQHHCWASSSSY